MRRKDFKGLWPSNVSAGAVGIDYRSCYVAQDCRGQIVSLALSLAFFISSHGYVGYRKTLGRGLSLGITSEKPYLEVIDLALPHIKDMVDEMCDDAKHQTKQLPPEQIGHWSRAVTCCAGCWLIRGHQPKLHLCHKKLHHRCPSLLWAFVHVRCRQDL